MVHADRAITDREAAARSGHRERHAFNAGTNIAAPVGSASITAGDLNGDGKLDVLIGQNNGANAYFFPGQGNGNFGANTALGMGGTITDVAAAELNADTGTTPASLVIADFSGDKLPDLVVTNSGQNNVGVYLQLCK